MMLRIKPHTQTPKTEPTTHPATENGADNGASNKAYAALQSSQGECRSRNGRSGRRARRPPPGRIPASLFGQAHAKPTINPEDKTAASTAKALARESRGAALVAAGALDGAPEPAGQRRAAEDELLSTRGRLLFAGACVEIKR